MQYAKTIANKRNIYNGLLVYWQSLFCGLELV